MDLGLKDRVALVCGASRGLGKAVALGLAREGARLAICSRNPENIQQAAEEIRQDAGTEVIPLPVDLSSSEETRRFFREALDHYGQVDILVNNAGGPPSLPFLEISEAHWQEAFQMTLMSAATLMKAVIPVMQAREVRTDHQPDLRGRKTTDPQPDPFQRPENRAGGTEPRAWPDSMPRTTS